MLARWRPHPASGRRTDSSRCHCLGLSAVAWYQVDAGRVPAQVAAVDPALIGEQVDRLAMPLRHQILKLVLVAVAIDQTVLERLDRCRGRRPPGRELATWKIASIAGMGLCPQIASSRTRCSTTGSIRRASAANCRDRLVAPELASGEPASTRSSASCRLRKPRCRFNFSNSASPATRSCSARSAPRRGRGGQPGRRRGCEGPPLRRIPLCRQDLADQAAGDRPGRGLGPGHRQPLHRHQPQRRAALALRGALLRPRPSRKPDQGAQAAPRLRPHLVQQSDRQPVPAARSTPPPTGSCTPCAAWHPRPRSGATPSSTRIRLALIKVAARVTEMATRIKVALPSCYPYQDSLALLSARAAKLPP